MNNQEQFAWNATDLDIKRSMFDLSHKVLTTFNVGELIPFYIQQDILPGDTFEIRTKILGRLQTPIFPTMDNLYLDVYYFFIPQRIVWSHTKEFYGENTETKWIPKTEYEIPQIVAPNTGWVKGTIMDQMGIPTNIKNISVSALPVRAYVETWNQWFRDQNLQDPAYYDKGDATVTGNNGENYITDAIKGGKCLPVNKYHDYFASALPGPLKGEPVKLPLGTTAPVITDSVKENIQNSAFIKFRDGVTQTLENGTHNVVSYTTDNSMRIYQGQGIDAGQSTSNALYPSNLFADLTNATAATVEDLRQAFQIQKFLERDARGGTRYREIIKSHFNVNSADARMQIPEYLGGKRIPIQIEQVVQTSGTISSGDNASPQGNTAAYSLTTDVEDSVLKSFTEHGIILGVCCLRTQHTYQQGIDRAWSARRKFDIYWPEFANLGEMSILNKEIYAQETNADNEVFGYQEAWAHYRYRQNRVAGAMRSNYQKTLDKWHYADNYESQPILGSEWIKETKNNVDRTLAVQSETEDQFLMDMWLDIKATRPLPMFSIPGLIDHN